MLETILQNLEIIAMAFSLFSACVLANILVKTHNNVKNLKQSFSFCKLLDGVLKMLCIGLTTALLAAVASAIPYVPIIGEMFGTPEIKEVVSYTVIMGLYVKAIATYFTKALTGINKAMNEQDLVEHD